MRSSAFGGQHLAFLPGPGVEPGQVRQQQHGGAQAAARHWGARSSWPAGLPALRGAGAAAAGWRVHLGQIPGAAPRAGRVRVRFAVGRWRAQGLFGQRGHGGFWRPGRGGSASSPVRAMLAAEGSSTTPWSGPGWRPAGRLRGRCPAPVRRRWRRGSSAPRGPRGGPRPPGPAVRRAARRGRKRPLQALAPGRAPGSSAKCSCAVVQQAVFEQASSTLRQARVVRPTPGGQGHALPGLARTGTRATIRWRAPHGGQCAGGRGAVARGRWPSALSVVVIRWRHRCAPGEDDEGAWVEKFVHRGRAVRPAQDMPGKLRPVRSRQTVVASRPTA